MGQNLKDLQRRIEELYLTTTGRLSYPMCQTLLESEHPVLVEELKRLKPEATEDRDSDMVRLAEARANLEAQLERYEAINRQWSQKFSPPELRRHLA